MLLANEFLFYIFSKLQEVEVKNQELLAEIDRLKKETEELRLRRGRERNCGCGQGVIRVYCHPKDGESAARTTNWLHV